MTQFKKTNEVIENANIIPAKQSYIYIGRLSDSKGIVVSNLPPRNIHWTKYQIKETDMRIKTATFSSPQYFDLTTGRYQVLIVSPYHENFMGLILTVEYDENKKIYNYQCQDWSRNYMRKVNSNIENVPVINYIRVLLTQGGTSFPTPTSAQLKTYSRVLSGLRPEGDYTESKWGGYTTINPMTSRYYAKIRGKPIIEVIRDVIYGIGGYIDIHFNEYGVLQFEPYQREDFFNTGLHLEIPEPSSRKLKFDTTNIITGALLSNSEDKSSSGTAYFNEVLVNFFGYYSIADTSKDKYAALGNKVDTTTTTKSTTKSTTKTNPYKTKKVWINSDNGSDDFKNKIANKLKKNGWTVHVGRTCSNCHYSDYSNVSKNHIYITLYNGFCAGTVQEAYSSSIQNQLKKKNVQLVIMWDSRTWTEKMKPYRYGDFTGYTAKRAWDDNFSKKDPKIKNVSDWLKKNNAIYCVYPTVDGLVEQFEAGGYFKWKQKK